MVRGRLAAGLLALGLGGCMLGPNYNRPAIPVPAAWREMPVAEAESLANTPWWELFQDPLLQTLIQTALLENHDLKIAVERIEEARATYGFTRADLYPRVDVGAAAARIDPRENGVATLPPGQDTAAFYSTDASVSWELDFFGRVRRASEAEQALLIATEEGRRSVVIALVAEVARVYVELRDADAQAEISRRTLASRREYIDLARDRFEGGVTSELDLRQAEAEFHRTESLVYDFERVVTQKENELSVLLGRHPGAVPRGRPITELPAPGAIPAGLPSELLDRRPDIREAEEVLHANTANIGAAKALLFPRIALTGSLGFASTELGDVFVGPARSWSIAGNLLQPIFNAGKNRRRVEIAESRQRQALYGYEQTILLAFRDVEDSLVGYRKSGQKRTSQTARVVAERQVLALAEQRYRGGVSDYLDVLDAQRSLFDAELDAAAAVRDHLVFLIQLYKALGGGWSAPDAAAGQVAPTTQGGG